VSAERGQFSRTLAEIYRTIEDAKKVRQPAVPKYLDYLEEHNPTRRATGDALSDSMQLNKERNNPYNEPEGDYP
jgi:hypothetical protein